VPVEPQNRTQFSVNGTKGVETISLHLSGHMEICQYAMQAWQSGTETHCISQTSNLRLSK